jgi:hypothetical protein
MLFRDVIQSTTSMKDLRHAYHAVGGFVAILEPFYKFNNLSSTGDLPIIESKRPITLLDAAKKITVTQVDMNMPPPPGRTTYFHIKECQAKFIMPKMDNYKCRDSI